MTRLRYLRKAMSEFLLLFNEVTIKKAPSFFPGCSMNSKSWKQIACYFSKIW